MWEAFLLQMNDFERYLETELRVMLDPVVARRPPPRRGQLEEAEQPVVPSLPVGGPAVDAIPVVAPVVTVPFAPGSSL